MTFSEVISSLNLWWFPVAALIVFFGVFVGVVVQVFRGTSAAEFERAAALPLVDGSNSKR